MGYDTYIQNPDGTPREGDEHYFRFGWTTGHHAFEVMANFGMVTDTPMPAWPQLTAYGLTKGDFALGNDASEATKQAIAKYREDWFAVRDWAEPEPTGIPSFKLHFNEGRLITPQELSAALAAYEVHPNYAIAEMPVGDLTWGRWTAFLRRARDLGGLRVH
ncbi:hypothetical protein [Streptomyces spiramyceticus]|uniref:hypothetical protein n=1 Tax=Streptomyces spiramyceticus TaxID=299717 RepID=UPI00237BC0D0|nr:hypothetical protein [Streptomyces spiramyceticus]